MSTASNRPRISTVEVTPGESIRLDVRDLDVITIGTKNDLRASAIGRAFGYAITFLIGVPAVVAGFLFVVYLITLLIDAIGGAA